MALGDLLLDSESEDGAIFKVFFCIACNQYHRLQLNENIIPHWTFDGNSDCPTFTPAMIIHDDKGNVVCHLKITGGMIKYFDDCGHMFAGLKISMAEA